MDCSATLSRVGVRVVAPAARRRATTVSSSSAFGPPIARGGARAWARRPAPAPIARPRASPGTRGSTLAAVAPEGLDAASHLADVAVDAWSVSGGTTLGARFAGVESKLFQAGLLPYLVYLWFLGRPAARTPPASNFGARFLLAFVFATIPAGIAAKTKYGDILANVDILHGSSESLLTVSNFLFAFGFAAALAESAEGAEGADASGAESSAPESSSSPLDSPIPPALALATLVAVAGGGAFALSAATAALDPVASLGLREEPANALSLPTWAVHVSSVTEWSIAMRLIWEHAETSGNPAWRGLSVAMIPFLASGFAACTFHLFYNAPEVNAMVPLQALLTLGGNVGCAVAAYRIVKEGERADAETASKETVAASTSNSSSPSSFPSWAPRPTIRDAMRLSAWTLGGSLALKYGELVAGDFFFEPTYAKALAVVAVPTAAWTATVVASPSDGAGAGEEGGGLSMARVKSFGKAGTLAYVLVELAFWALALPAAIGWYRVAEGTWLDLSDPGDKARLLGAGAVFINGVRLMVPFRLAAALALAPAVEKAMGGAEGESEGAEGESEVTQIGGGRE